MPIINHVKPHCYCKPPYDTKPSTIYGIGTIWQCENCSKKFRLTEDQREGGLYWQEMSKADKIII